MSSSAINQSVFQAKISNVQNAADSSSVYSAGVWSFKNSTALTSVTITDSGNVGIGTASPTSKLHVIDGNNTFITNDANTYPRLTTNNSDAQLGLFRSGANAGGGYIGGSGTAAFLVLSSSFQERMRIDASGAITLGSPGNTLHVINGVGRFQKTEASGGFRTVTVFHLDSGATACGGIQVINGSTLPQFFTGSDERLKSNIQDDNTDYLSKINKVKLKTFTLNSDESQTTQHGVIAQELQMVFPDLVSEGEDGMLRVGSDYSYKLIGAIQELSAKNGEQSSRIEALEARLAALESK